MPPKFLNGLDELKWITKGSSLTGQWSQIGDQHQFKSDAGGVMNFWPSSKTVNFQVARMGKRSSKH